MVVKRSHLKMYLYIVVNGVLQDLIMFTYFVGVVNGVLQEGMLGVFRGVGLFINETPEAIFFYLHRGLVAGGMREGASEKFT